MVTDRQPRRGKALEEFLASDRIKTLPLPVDDSLSGLAEAIEQALEAGRPAPLRAACLEFLAAASAFYAMPPPLLKVLAARPLRMREGGWAVELFGDYDPETTQIRTWMRTAVQKKVTSFGTFFSTLVHEFCHHMDFVKYGWGTSPHTRGFYERVGVLYHHARATPVKTLAWRKSGGGVWRIDWGRMRRTP